MILVTRAIKHDSFDFRCLCFLRDELSKLCCAFDCRFGLCLFERSGNNGPACIIIHELHIHTPERAMYGETRALSSSLNTSANAVFSAEPVLELCRTHERKKKLFRGALGSRLSDFARNELADIPDALPFVGLRRAERTEIGGNKTHLLLIDPRNDEDLLIFGIVLNLHTLGRFVVDRMRVTEVERHSLAFCRRLVPDTDDFMLLYKSL